MRSANSAAFRPGKPNSPAIHHSKGHTRPERSFRRSASGSLSCVPPSLRTIRNARAGALSVPPPRWPPQSLSPGRCQIGLRKGGERRREAALHHPGITSPHGFHKNFPEPGDGEFLPESSSSPDPKIPDLAIGSDPNPRRPRADARPENSHGSPRRPRGWPRRGSRGHPGLKVHRRSAPRNGLTLDGARSARERAACSMRSGSMPTSVPMSFSSAKDVPSERVSLWVGSPSSASRRILATSWSV